jgi:hypothetical protein
VFHMDVVKVNRVVTRVAMVVHVCCKLMFSMFRLIFPMYVASVCMLQVCLSRCCIYFHTYDESVLSRCCICLQWFQVFFSVCFICFQTYVVIITSGCFQN